VERADRAPVATFFAPELAGSSGTLTLGEDAAHHARVRRFSDGAHIRLTDGRGTLATGAIARVAKSAMDVALDDGSLRAAPRPAPVHLLVPVADRDRMLWLAEKAAELAVTTWVPVRWARSRSVSPRGEGAAFSEKVRKRMVAALEQSAGAWLPAVEPELEPDAACARFAVETRVLLDAEGTPLPPLLGGARAVALAVGPEGGLEPRERELFVGAGWRAASLAPTVLRFETAGVAAAAVARSLLTRPGAG
jgi:16S rRNA (uracil1498-N3)-methyltransferase